jgi:hypothetical protein
MYISLYVKDRIGGTMKLRSMILLQVLVSMTILFVTETTAQTSGLKLQNTTDGYSGEFVTGSTKVMLEHRVTGADSFTSRIEDSEKRTIVECIRTKDAITVTIKEVHFIFFTDKSAREKNPPILSETDQTKFATFVKSEESAVIRRLITELITQKVVGLKGFVAIAMVLGDGPGMPENLQSNANCKSPKLVQMYASFTSKDQTSIKSLAGSNAIPGRTVTNDCNGCCGVGCIGCTGCYTSACLAHDNCVAAYGYINPICFGLLADAVASLVECSVS